MTLIIVHYHLRPGGIRRVIELATPYLVRAAAHRVTRVVLATGQSAERGWHDQFAGKLSGVRVEVFVERTFRYLSETNSSPGQFLTRLRRRLQRLLDSYEAGDCIVWAHNLGVGRNLFLSRELAAACADRNIPLIAHHHDWWFDNRWARWPEMQRLGFRHLDAPARAVFPPTDKVRHAAINQADAAISVITRSGCPISPR